MNDSQLPELLPTQLDYTASGRTIWPALAQTNKYVQLYASDAIGSIAPRLSQ